MVFTESFKLHYMREIVAGSAIVFTDLTIGKQIQGLSHVSNVHDNAKMSEC